MSRRFVSLARRSLPIAVVLALGGCTAAGSGTGAGPGTPAAWSVDVNYADLTPGTCLGASFSYSPETGYAADSADTFTVDAAGFSSVRCDTDHRAQVVGVVGIPVAPEWEKYGTRVGPAHDEAKAWVDSVCSAYQVMLAVYAEAAGLDALVVGANYGQLGDTQLGACIAHREDFAPLHGGIDLDRLQSLAAGVPAVDAPLPSAAEHWMDPRWYDVEPGECVSSFVSPDDATYSLVDCATPHIAQFLAWVDMPSEWAGTYADSEAEGVVASGCAAMATLLAADPAIVVESSQVAEEWVIGRVHLAQCWAHRDDLAPFSEDFSGALG